MASLRKGAFVFRVSFHKACASFCQVALLISRIWSLSLSDHGELNSLHAFLYYFNERKVLLHLEWQQDFVIVGLTCA